MKFKWIFISGFTILLILTIFYYRKNPLTTKIIFPSGTIYTEVAITDKEKELGLGYRDLMPSDRGMLFVYDHKEIYSFWMKGMRFPLDFVWIDGNEIVDITENVPFLTNGRITAVAPRRQVDKILELNAGTVQRLKLRTGDKIIIKT